MPLSLNKRVWVLAERLYIHSYSPEEFLAFLKNHEIEYHGEPYEEFEKTFKGIYVFMSEDNLTFADFMEGVPSYKYLPLLQDIVFDKTIISTTADNWNYYGEFIKGWHPSLIELLKLADVEVQEAAKELLYNQPAETPQVGEFVAHDFGDPFLDYIKKEINNAHANNLFVSVMFLSRKILESIIVRVFEVVFPKLVNKEYAESNHALWYDKDRGKYQNFGVMLNNLKDKAGNFNEDKDLILEFVTLVRPFKDETNRCVHQDYKVPDEPYINQWKIPHTLYLARKLFRKYCNP